MGLFESLEAGDVRAVDRELRGGADPNAVAKSGDSALAVAARSGNARLVKALLTKGANPNSNRTVVPSLIHAAGLGHHEIVKLLLAAKARVDERDEDGSTALMEAAAGGHLKVVDQLLEAGARARLKPRKGSGALQAAVEKKHWKVVERLLPMASASERKEVERVRAEATGALAKPNPKQVLKFLDAAGAGDVDAMKKFLAQGMPVDACTPTSRMTALMTAAIHGRFKVVRLLLKSGADLSRKNAYGENAISSAAAAPELKMFDYLYRIASPKDRKPALKHLPLNRMQYAAWRKWRAPS